MPPNHFKEMVYATGAKGDEELLKNSPQHVKSKEPSKEPSLIYYSKGAVGFRAGSKKIHFLR